MTSPPAACYGSRSMRERLLGGDLHPADDPDLLEQLLGSLGANTVVGAGAVVTRDLPANALAVGSPARVVREMVA